MARLLLYGDLHIGASRVDNNKIINTIDFVNQTAKNNEVDGIINMGDTLDCSGGRKQLLKPYIISLLQKLDFSEHLDVSPKIPDSRPFRRSLIFSG
jgi:hypothetical protein